jgi:hypothetical protein
MYRENDKKIDIKVILIIMLLFLEFYSMDIGHLDTGSSRKSQKRVKYKVYDMDMLSITTLMY